MGDLFFLNLRLVPPFRLYVFFGPLVVDALALEKYGEASSELKSPLKSSSFLESRITKKEKKIKKLGPVHKLRYHKHGGGGK